MFKTVCMVELGVMVVLVPGVVVPGVVTLGVPGTTTVVVTGR
jgi:hypothetical protein